MSNNPKGRVPRACPWVSKSKPVFTLFLSLLIPLFSSFLFPLFSFAETETEETLTITTYYPAPYGVYNEMRSKRMAVGDNYINGSTFSWDAGTIDTNADLVVEGNVGIGTTAPSAGGAQDLKLDVDGAVGAKFYCDENGNNCASAPLGGGFFGAPQKVELASPVSGGPLGTITILSNTVTMPANGGPFRVLVSYAIHGGGPGFLWAVAWIEDNLGNKFAVKHDYDDRGFQTPSAVEISPVNYNSGQTVTFYLKGNGLSELFITDQNGVGLNPTWLMTQIIKTE